MGIDVATQAEAWHIYDLFYENTTIFFAEEPRGLESIFRSLTVKQESSTKEWADAYLAAFAEAAGLRLVTFDKVLAARTKRAILLQP